MFEEQCRDLEYLPLQYAWNKHCGGGWWEFTSRSFGLVGSGLLAFSGTAMIVETGGVGAVFGSALIAKSINDGYEALYGRSGYARQAMGDPLYDAVDVALIGYGFMRKVSKINYLGNPEYNLFFKDPLTKELALKQYSAVELIHLTLSTTITAANDYKKYGDRLSREMAWEIHLERTKSNFD